MQLFCIIGLALIPFIICTQQDKLPISSSEEQVTLEKRLLDSNSLPSIPLFRGSNLGIFVKKRPHNTVHDDATMRRKEPYLTSFNNENILARVFKNNEQYQRRFEDYPEHPGPILG
ncbi:unnamed protein product [Rotaria magnacalcarata]|uniref:Uncharacterized protein n=1 Tax=Rotaria magnacalcarata TaxID=392030 RepID=A0A816ZMF9_9BILA|nr:unnamed protein product [Rotaria magnacalcarata]CAF1578640.1 unnamed protein product [Rotaria magnacalcarata]CAF2160374.1 unnamed protein product [Rotaria magnacalcarata]CAF2206967.1 unnamed protein product [Rotaria magnacalcarata]CAF2214583.1 unnamed protein product [Rotaria magnacalcarata]